MQTEKRVVLTQTPRKMLAVNAAMINVIGKLNVLDQARSFPADATIKVLGHCPTNIASFHLSFKTITSPTALCCSGLKNPGIPEPDGDPSSLNTGEPKQERAPKYVHAYRYKVLAQSI